MGNMGRLLPVLALGILLQYASVNAQAATFTFTKVADTSDGYPAFRLPAVNSSGTVAFATAPVGNVGNANVYTWSGGVMTPVFNGIAAGLSTNAAISDPSINDSAQVAFISPVSVYRMTGGVVGTIYSANSKTQIWNGTISNSGNVYFTENNNTVQNFNVTNGGPVTTIETVNTTTQAYGHPATSSNDHSVVNRSTTFSTEKDYVILDGATIVSPSTKVSDVFITGFPTESDSVFDISDVDINSGGTVVFSANWGAHDYRLFRYDNGVIARIALGKAIPAINDQGMVAALFTDGTKSLKVGLGAPTDTVLAVGSAFMGSTVTDLSFSHEGLSDGNYLTFSATLADGRTGIYLTAVPEPAILGLLAPVILLRRKR
jgi:hypothetical protein